jgi:hypothetical protein
MFDWLLYQQTNKMNRIVGIVIKQFLLSFIFFFNLEILIAQDCNCESNIKIAVSKIANSYAGFNDKVKNRKAYEAFTDSLIVKSKLVSNFFECYHLLVRYASFFRDPHLGMRLQYDPAFKQRFNETFQTNSNIINVDSLYDKMKAKDMDTLEGIWTDYSETRKILISKNNAGDYIGYIYKGDSRYWYKGQERFKIVVKPFISTAIYYKDDRVKKTLNAYLKADLIYIQGYEYLTKDGSGAFVDESTNFQLIQDKAVGILKIPDLSGWNWSTIDSVITVNTANLENCKLLIIDFRDNGGGGYDGLKKIYPYVFTRKVPNERYWVMSSDDNINDFENLLKQGAYLDSAQKQTIASQIRILEKNKGKLCEIKNENLFKLSRFNTKPPKVVFLINEETSSAAEMFVKIARENSTKVKVYGKNSYGVMDYGHVGRFDLECKIFKLLIPKSRSHWVDKVQYDYKGITPDVRIPIEVSDWIAFVLKAESVK